MRTIKSASAGIAAATLALTLSACGAADQSKAPTPSPSSATATPTPTYDADTATDGEKWAEYQRLLTERSIASGPYSTSQDEATSVAKNLCDNSASDMSTYVAMNKTLYADQAAFENNKLDSQAFVSAYCPSLMTLLEGAFADADAAAETTAAAPNPADFTLAVKIKRKKCFGSAGCNVTYVINPSYHGTADVSTGSYDITYQVTGDESGPIINTFTLEDGTMSFDSEESASTKSSKVKLKAKVTEITAR